MGRPGGKGLLPCPFTLVTSDKAWPGVAGGWPSPCSQLHVLAAEQNRTGYNSPSHGHLLGAGGDGLQSPLVTINSLLFSEACHQA